ncbi:unnamed protein product [Tilletia controversa]|nr:unnamed protein product [Tilletia controversa]
MDERETEGVDRPPSPSQAEAGVDPAATSTSTSTTVPLSKRAQKRLAREREWEERKPLIKAQRKEKDRLAKEARKAARSAAEDHAYTSGEDQHQAGRPSASKKIRIDHHEGEEKQPLPPRSEFNATLVIDLGFDDLMNTKEIKSLAHQLTFVYAANRNSQAPFRDLVFVGSGGGENDNSNNRKLFSEDGCQLPPPAAGPSSIQQGGARKALSFAESPTGSQLDARTQGSWQRWRGLQVIDSGEGLPALWAESTTPGGLTRARQDVVYLTADSENVIHELEEGKAYVIGGIVDKNRYKNLCFAKAQALGIQTAQLPISEALLDPSPDDDDDDSDSEAEVESSANANNKEKGSVTTKLRTRKVLTVNQVVDILLGWTEQRASNVHVRESTQSGAAPSEPKDADVPMPTQDHEQEQSKSSSLPLPDPPANADSSEPWSTAQLDGWWRAAVRKAFPQRKLKERTSRRRPRNEELLAAAAAQARDIRSANEDQDDGRGEVMEAMADVDEDQLYNDAQLHEK